MFSFKTSNLDTSVRHHVIFEAVSEIVLQYLQYWDFLVLLNFKIS